jgi:prephenate dehydrogenase
MRIPVAIAHVLAAALALAERKEGSLGSAASELARRIFRGVSTDRVDGDPAVFAVAKDAKPITSEDVDRSLAEWP